MKCSKCGEQSVIWDGFASHPENMQQVCMNCGAINSEEPITAYAGKPKGLESPPARPRAIRRRFIQKGSRQWLVKKFS